jgi:hypothetical protein
MPISGVRLHIAGRPSVCIRCRWIVFTRDIVHRTTPATTICSFLLHPDPGYRGGARVSAPAGRHVAGSSSRGISLGASHPPRRPFLRLLRYPGLGFAHSVCCPSEEENRGRADFVRPRLMVGRTHDQGWQREEGVGGAHSSLHRHTRGRRRGAAGLSSSPSVVGGFLHPPRRARRWCTYTYARIAASDLRRYAPPQDP